MLDVITKQIINQYSPDKIMLFGSLANRMSTSKNDIDLCIVIDTPDKRRMVADMYYTIESEKPIDILIYTPDEWEACINDNVSFAYKINTEGVTLYG